MLLVVHCFCPQVAGVGPGQSLLLPYPTFPAWPPSLYNLFSDHPLRHILIPLRLSLLGLVVTHPELSTEASLSESSSQGSCHGDYSLGVMS